MLLTVLLSGCSCQHEWSDADCTNPQICSKCQEVSGDPLGHSFQAATCDTPEVCSRCGATQGQALGHQWDAPDCTTPATCRVCGLTDGEPLGHDYDIWTQIDSDMTHTCNLCGNVETIPYDPLLYTQDQLLGNWDLFALGSVSSAQYGPVYALHFSKDFQVSGRFLNMDFVGTWSLSYITDDYYEGTLTISGVEHVFYYSTPDQVVMIPLYNDYDEYIANAKLKRVDDAEPYVIGTWSVEYNNASYQLKLMSDRSFLASFDIPFHGKWYLYPTTPKQGHSMNVVYMIGATCYENRSDVFFLERPIEEGSGSIQFYGFWGDDDKVFFTQTSTDGIATAEEAETLRALREKAKEAEQATQLDEFKNALVGQWVSQDYFAISEFEALTPAADGSIDIIDIITKSSVYSIQMEADGSFTGILGDSVAGTWVLVPDTLLGDETYSSIDGTITLSDSQETYTFTVSYTADYGYSLYFQWNGLQINFLCFTSEDYAKLTSGRQEFTGTWSKCSYGVYVDSSASLSETEGCSLTLHEDGTLSGKLVDGVVSGTWSYCGYDPNAKYYTASLEIDGQTVEATFSESSIYFNLTNAGGQRACYSFSK